jgi:hypothetical protein
VKRIRRRFSCPIALICLISGAAIIAGCGDGSGDTSAVDVTATDFGYDLPDEITGGLVTMNFVNDGVEPHEYALVRSDDRHTADQLATAIDKTFKRGREPPKWVEDIGSYGVQTAGASIAVTRPFEPGNYAFICFLPGPGGKSHLELGMRRAFTVSGDNGTDPPDPAGVVAATKDAFEVPAVSSGEQTLEVRDEGAKPIDFELVRFNPGKDLADVLKWFQGGLKGEAPATLFGGASFPGDKSLFFRAQFESGAGYELENPSAGVRQKFTVD